MANVLSEPFMEHVAPKSSQIHEEITDQPISDLVLEAQKLADENPTDPEAWVKLGRAYRRQKMHREAINAYSIGLSYNPFYHLLYRHKGHAYINIAKYAEAAAAFEMGLRIDPTSWDCWYHQGLAYFLMEDYERAEYAYSRCYAITEKDNEIAAITDWYWMTLMHLGKKKEAEELISKIHADMDVDANEGYFKRCLVYKGVLKADDVAAEAEQLDDHMYATQAYGVAYYYMLNGDNDKAYAILKRITDRNEGWSGFAEHAARRDIKKFKNQI